MTQMNNLVSSFDKWSPSSFIRETQKCFQKTSIYMWMGVEFQLKSRRMPHACLYIFSIMKSVIMLCCKPLLIILLCGRVLGKDVSDRWYNEVNQYNFNQPGFSSGTGKHALLIMNVNQLTSWLYNEKIYYNPY